MKRLVVPKFETEAEEANGGINTWRSLGDNLIEAMENGTAHRGGPAALFRETRVMNIRMNNSDLERIEKLAEEKGISNQACMNLLLRDALDREDAKRQTPAA